MTENANTSLDINVDSPQILAPPQQPQQQAHAHGSLVNDSRGLPPKINIPHVNSASNLSQMSKKNSLSSIIPKSCKSNENSDISIINPLMQNNNFSTPQSGATNDDDDENSTKEGNPNFVGLSHKNDDDTPSSARSSPLKPVQDDLGQPKTVIPSLNSNSSASPRSHIILPPKMTDQMPRRSGSSITTSPQTIVPNRDRKATSYVPPDLKVINALQEEREELTSSMLNTTLLENPEFLAFRERALPTVGGYSFANITHTNTIIDPATINRHSILELVYQHLEAIGMYTTAETLAKESGLMFQKSSDQPWGRTNLHLLVSLAVGHRESVWDVDKDQKFIPIKEPIEEDLFSSPYREDPTTIWEEFFNSELNVTFSDQSECTLANVQTASLKRIISFFIRSDKGSKDKNYSDSLRELFLTIQSFTSAEHFLEHLVTLFDCKPLDEKYNQNLTPNIVTKLQAKVISLIKTWITFHGLFIGQKTLKYIIDFFNRIESDESLSIFHQNVKAILELMPTLKYGTKTSHQSTDFPEPAISIEDKIIFSSHLTLLDPDPLEVARQLTLIFHKKFSRIHSLEFIIGMKNRRATIETPTISEFFVMNEKLSQIIAKTFLEAENKYEAYQQYVKIARSFYSLANFDTLSVLLRLLLRDDFRIIGTPSDQTVQELQQMLEETGEYAKNKKSEERQAIFQKNDMILIDQIRKQRPAIPNIYAELKKADSEFIKQPDYINGLLNWEKIKNLGKKCSILYRFQNVHYYFVPIPQIQKIFLENEVSLPFEEFENKMEQIIDDLRYR